MSNNKKIEVRDHRVGAFTPEEIKTEKEKPIKLRISPIRAPYAPEDHLVQEPGETPMDNTDLVALGAPRFRKEEKIVTVLSAENEVVKWYKQRFVGPRCKCLDNKNAREEEKSSTIIDSAYCTTCYHTGIVGGYDYYKRVSIFNVYMEWGGIEPPFPSGRLEINLDFEYHITPGDFFELGKVVADIGFNVDVGVNERHDNEGKPCLWRVLDVVVEKGAEGDFPVFWTVSCRNVETYEPIYGWFVRQHSAEEEG